MFKRYCINRTISAMNQLDNFTLAQIGITRSEIRKHVEEIYRND